MIFLFLTWGVFFSPFVLDLLLFLFCVVTGLSGFGQIKMRWRWATTWLISCGISCPMREMHRNTSLYCQLTFCSVGSSLILFSVQTTQTRVWMTTTMAASRRTSGSRTSTSPLPTWLASWRTPFRRLAKWVASGRQSRRRSELNSLPHQGHLRLPPNRALRLWTK